jgi:hypothetical protein
MEFNNISTQMKDSFGEIAVIRSQHNVGCRFVPTSEIDQLPKVIKEVKGDSVLLSSNINVEMAWRIYNHGLEPELLGKLEHVRVNHCVVFPARIGIEYRSTMSGILIVFRKFCEIANPVILATASGNDPTVIVVSLLDKILGRTV